MSATDPPEIRPRDLVEWEPKKHHPLHRSGRVLSVSGGVATVRVSANGKVYRFAVSRLRLVKRPRR